LSLPEYTFVSWLRRGLASEIAEADRLVAAPEPAGDPKPQAIGRPTLPVELTINALPAPGAAQLPTSSVTRDVQILGPGDVAGLKSQEAILRTHPLDGALTATPDELAFVEFYDEDLPWRYTPAKANASRLRPWLALLVLADGEYTVVSHGEGSLAVLTFAPSAQLPPNEESWAWAHAQVSGDVTAELVATAIGDAPDQARSRLLSPRRLGGDTRYEAFLVPAFEAGRLAGLGRAPEGVVAQLPSWGLPVHAGDREMPVYHRFSFRTSTDGDFETLALRLKPHAVGASFGSRELDVSDPGFGLDAKPGATVRLESALAPQPPQVPGGTGFQHAPFDAASATATEVEQILDAAGAALLPGALVDPIVVPPSYGLAHKGVPRIVDARNKPALEWLVELNLDLRSRAAAGLGAEVVRKRQEELMQRAWEQVSRVEEANQRLREAELAKAAAAAVLHKHLKPLQDDRLTILTAPVQAGLRVPAGIGIGTPRTATLRAAVDQSVVPAAAQSPAFRRLVRPQRPLVKRLGPGCQAGALQQDLLQKMDRPAGSALTTSPLRETLEGSVDLGLVEAAVALAADTIATRPPRPFEIFLQLADEEVSQAPGSTDYNTVSAADLRSALQTRIRALFPGLPFDAATPAVDTVERRVWDLVLAVQGVAADVARRATIKIGSAAFRKEFSDDSLGKSRGAVTVLCDPPPAPDPAKHTMPTVGRSTAADDAQAFKVALGDFALELNARPDPVPRPLLDPNERGHSTMLAALDPAVTIVAQMQALIPSIAHKDPALPPLAPIQAYPTFPDPMFNSLRELSQDYVIANVSDLPPDSLSVMEPNRRFIEAYLAGANVALNQELLWREYPTDQRGTPFKVFWDARAAAGDPDREDIAALDTWSGELGSHSPNPASVLVLVVRGELLERFPGTVVAAQRAKFTAAGTRAPRVLDDTAPLLNPVFGGRLDPDILLVGFELSLEEARGRRVASTHGAPDPGWFFVFMERPGEPRFGLDSASEPPPLDSWDALAWSTLDGPPGSPFVTIAPNAALTPTTVTATTPRWGRTSADQASILLQSPAILARHASEMLP
jgi:hypothetical protein